MPLRGSSFGTASRCGHGRGVAPSTTFNSTVLVCLVGIPPPACYRTSPDCRVGLAAGALHGQGAPPPGSAVHHHGAQAGWGERARQKLSERPTCASHTATSDFV